MTVHLMKLCVGIADVDDLKARQNANFEARVRSGKSGRLVHRTKQMPRRRFELCDGGSIFWVIKGVMQVRQKLLSLDEGIGSDGRKCCELVLGPELVEVRPVPRRAFQGWRYLEADDAPDDLGHEDARGISLMPVKMRRELLELALI